MTTRSILPLTLISLLLVMGCAHVHAPRPDRTQSLESYSASFGLIDEAGNLTPTNVIPHRVGVVYGWKLAIESSKPTVRVKEVFELPGGARWTGGTLPDRMKLVSLSLSKDGSIREQEFDMQIFSNAELQGMHDAGTNPRVVVGKGTAFMEKYGIVDDDPRGTHRISIFVDSQLVNRFTFQVVGE